MFLCDVELGRQGRKLGYNGQSSNADSYIHDGLSHKSWSDAAFVHPDLKGVQIPNVPRPSVAVNHFTKEYIIMNPAQIRQRYIFHFKLK
jgi:poly [ADP-ribose] polymerase